MKHNDVFVGLGKFVNKCHIQISDKIWPVAKPPRRIPLTLQTKVKTKLGDLEKRNIIIKVEQPQELTINQVVVENLTGSFGYVWIRRL